MRTLPANRQSLAMAQFPVASQIHQALDALLHFAAEIAFNLVPAIDRIADTNLLLCGEIVGLPGAVDLGLIEDLGRGGAADSVDIGERDIHALVFRELNACYTSH